MLSVGFVGKNMSVANPSLGTPTKRTTTIGNKGQQSFSKKQKPKYKNQQKSKQQMQNFTGQATNSQTKIYKQPTCAGYLTNTIEELDQQEVKNGTNIDIISGEVQTVFRVTPYGREALLKHKQNHAIKILFLDEGNSCRSILAEALSTQVLNQLNTPLPVSFHSASIGAPIQDTLKDPKLSAIAQSLNLQLPKNKQQIFTEMKDMINFDLVLVMDRFDYEDVYREVSVMNVINPGTHFTNKIKCLGEFKMMLKGEIDLNSLEINDPFYGTLNEEEQMQNMVDVAQSIQQASIGLVAFLLALNKCISPIGDESSVSLKGALEQSLECPLVSEHLAMSVLSMDQIKNNLQAINSMSNMQINTSQQNERQQNQNSSSSDIYYAEGSKKRKHGYWNNPENVEKELRKWMTEHRVRDRMPGQRELRRSGANSLSASIDRQGGFRVMALKLGLPITQQFSGYWDEPGNLELELTPYLATGPDGQIYLPSQEFLRGLGRNDLLGAIRKCGGCKVVAKRLGVNYRHGKYSDLEGLLQEIKNCLLVNGWQQQHRLPTSKEFDAIGRSDVVNGIKKYGGFFKIAKLLKLEYKVQYTQRASINKQTLSQISSTNKT